MIIANFYFLKIEKKMRKNAFFFSKIHNFQFSIFLLEILTGSILNSIVYDKNNFIRVPWKKGISFELWMGRNEGKNEKCMSQSLHHLFIKKIN